MSVVNFENKKWQTKEQTMNFRLITALAMINKGFVLDLGCGDGIFLSKLKEKGIAGEGLDISEVAIQKAMANGLKVRQFDFSCDKLPFTDNYFSTVTLLDVLEHLYQPQKVLQEASRVAKEIVVVVPNFSSLPARLQVLRGLAPENNTPQKGHVYWFNLEILRKLLKENGWQIVEMQTNTFFEHYFLLKNIFRFFAKAFPKLFALSFVVRANKSL